MQHGLVFNLFRRKAFRAEYDAYVEKVKALLNIFSPPLVARLAHQRAAYLDAAAVDHGERLHGLEQPRHQRRAEDIQQRLHLFHISVVLRAESLAPEQVEHQPVLHMLVVADDNVVEHRERQRQARALEGPRHAAAVDVLRRLADDVLAVVGDGAAARLVQASQYIEEGCLAGTVGAQQPEDLALSDRHVQAVQRRQAAEPHGQVPDFDHGLVAHREVSRPKNKRVLRGSSPSGRNSRIAITSAA